MQKKLFSKSKCVSNMIVSCDHKESLIGFEGGSETTGKKERPDPEYNDGMLKCLFPTKLAPAEFPEAKSLRKFQMLLLLLEFLYIFNDVYFFGSVYMAIFEVPRAWMCYYNFITLNRCLMNVYMVYVVIGATFSIFSILTVGFSGVLNLILFPAQLALMVFTAYLLWFKLDAYTKGKQAYNQGLKDKASAEPAAAETKA